MTKVVEIPVNKIKNQLLKRSISEEGIEHLCSSIKKLGILEPLLVVEHEGSFTLLAGRRRLEAAQMINMATVPCLIIPADQEKALAVTLHENLFREHLNTMDEVNLYLYLRDTLGYSNRRIAEFASKKEAYISQRLAISSWHPKLQDALKEENVHFSIARELAHVDDTNHMLYLLRQAVEHGANYRTVRYWVQQWKQSMVPPAPHDESEDLPDLQTTKQHVVSNCFWCEVPVDIDKVVVVHFCEKCYGELATAKRGATKR